MNEKHVIKIAEELKISLKQIIATAELLAEDATVPFIARYRKEVTGSLDEVAIMAIRDRLEQLAELDKRREAIFKVIDELGKLTPELKAKFEAAETMAVLEDLYLPYKPKRRTRATIAKEKGLEPLAKEIFEQGDFNVAESAQKFIDKEKEVESADDALAGARDIIAEWINEDQQARASIRQLFETKGTFVTKVIPGKEEDAAKFKDYFEFEESVTKAPSHRVLAMRRGAKEKVLMMRIVVPEDNALDILIGLFVKADNSAGQQVKTALADSFKRLMLLSLETDIRLATKKQADLDAIKVFAENLRQLLMASPLGQKIVMAVDPGFRSGCKVVFLDKQGKLLYNDTIFPHGGQARAVKEAEKTRMLCERFNVEAVAIGNGTASRETESFIKSAGLSKDVQIVMVNESGASIYSASQTARDEFPDHDITVRGSVSIGRRLMDPLAELVKIDAKSIGVGQYQHDVDQKKLKQSLDDTVMSCVNSVGVEVNTASKELLTYVSGLSSSLAQRFVAYRDENGAFKSREDVRKVSGLGDKTFQQCAGFLRVNPADNPLDASAVHPESYPIVDAMAADLGCTVKDLIESDEMRQKIELKKYVTETVGLPTLNDIVEELSKPGRDPREKFEAFDFAEGINKVSDLEIGMKLPGIITNITAFGAFVDIGVHQDGLVHISQMADRYISDPTEIVKVHQKVDVTVKEIDAARNRIALSMRKDPDKKQPPKQPTNKGPQNRKPKPKQKPKAAPKSNKPLAEQLTLGW